MSTIRSWLNGYAASYNTVGTDFTSDNFIDAAFTTEEKAKIVAFRVPDHKNPSYNTSPGSWTRDKLFLLSIVEVNDVWATEVTRRADATPYAVKQGGYVYGSTSGKYTHDGSCADVHCIAFWWLRSPGANTNNATFVRDDGSVHTYGNEVNIDYYGIRPAMWVQY